MTPENLRDISYASMRLEWWNLYDAKHVAMVVKWFELHSGDDDPLMEDYLRAAISERPDIIFRIKNPSKSLIKKALRVKPSLVRFMKIDDEEIQLMLLKLRKRNLYNYFVNPTDEVKKAHILNDYKNIMDIENPSSELIELAIENHAEKEWILERLGNRLSLEAFKKFIAFNKAASLNHIVNPPFEFAVAYTEYISVPDFFMRDYYDYMSIHGPSLTYEQKSILFRIDNRSMYGYGIDFDIISDNVDYLVDRSLTLVFANGTKSEKAVEPFLRNC